MKWQRLIGLTACIVLIISCFMKWAWYPDIKEYFTGFYSKKNYYGRPGILLCFFAVTGILFYWLKKAWSDRLNMIFSAIATAYAITSFLRFTSGYDGFVPDKQPGVYVMITAALINLVMSVLLMSLVKTQVPVERELTESSENKEEV
jgi:predicted PurR-regulated permease PerM